MATYYPISNNQKDVLPTPYSPDQKLASYHEPSLLPSSMMMYLSHVSSAGPGSEDLVGSLSFVDTLMGDPKIVQTTQLGLIDGEQNLQSHSLLSLSLGTQRTSEYPYANTGHTGLSSFLGSNYHISSDETESSKADAASQSKDISYGEYLPSGFDGDLNMMKPEAYSYQNSGFAGPIFNAKYLKIAQELLDEVISVREALKKSGSDTRKAHGLDGSTKSEMSSDPRETTMNSSSELSPAERHDLQNKMTKLSAMVDEVDRRYKQYCHQMQVVVSSFDVIAGCGAAKSYTLLAHQTISRHFRCLRDAISDQIRVTRRRLGEQETSATTQGGISRLRYVDQQLRQQRALQHLGMMPHAWRPQRGLPETSVTILRAWLFEHFLHPYPKDSEKIMLARKTGLTRSQVANWFINARVRLWKPMIEDIYKEEIGDSDPDPKSSPEAVENGSHSVHEPEPRYHGPGPKSVANPDEERSGPMEFQNAAYEESDTEYANNLEDYHCMDRGNQRFRFSNSQFLHDFVS